MSTALATDAYNYMEVFAPVEGQRDYLWGAGTSHTGSGTGDADTRSHLALVQLGIGTLPPTDYEILADRLRLSADYTPDAVQAASGEPLVARVVRAT